MSDETVRRRVTVIGTVQGVNYRSWVEEEAGARGLAGWVRNADDGSVEAVLEGEPGAVAEMVEQFEDGPPGAEVEDVDAVEEDPEGLSGFETR
jgi:acylphosphatase